MQLAHLKNSIPAHCFNKFLHIDDVKRYSSQDMKMLAIFGQILAQHDAQERFGISLLHKHFDLQEGEIIVETKSIDSKEFTISVSSIYDQNNKVPSMWRFVEGEKTIQATQWVQSNGYNSIGHVIDSDLPLLLALRDTIIELGCINRFGIGLLHRNSKLKDSEILMESTDEDNRLQEMKLIQKSTLDKDGSIQTLWSFKGNLHNMAWVCTTWCDYNSGHRNRHRRDGRPT